jgi:hypothetical protein
MDLSVYIFIILFDVFIVYTIFAIYFYVLFKYYLHTIERNGIMYFFNKHMNFYNPVIKLTKEYSKTDVNDIINTLKNQVDNTPNIDESTDFKIGTIMIITSILTLFSIVIIYFWIYYKKIVEQITLSSIIFTFIINFVLLISFELMFLFLVYCNIDVINFQKVLNI